MDTTKDVMCLTFIIDRLTSKNFVPSEPCDWRAICEMMITNRIELTYTKNCFVTYVEVHVY